VVTSNGYIDKTQINNSKPTIISGSLKLVFFTALIAILVLIRDILGIGINKYILVGIASLCLLLVDKYDIYAFIAFITPFSVGISYTYISLIALAVLILKEKGKISIQITGLVCMALILMIEFFSIIRGNFEITNYLRFAAVFILAFYRMLDSDIKYDNKKIVIYFVLGYWVAVIALLGQSLSYYSITEFLRTGGLLNRFGNTKQLLDIEEGMRISYNPNGLGNISMCAMLLSLVLYKIDNRIVYIISAIGSALVGIMTQSRTFVVVSIIGMAFFILFNQEDRKGKGRTIVVVTAGAVAVYFLITRVLYDYLLGLLKRWDMEDFSNGRVDITKEYFEKMFQSIDRFIFGVGLQNYNEKYNMSMACHNATQEVLVVWGCIGLIIVFVLLCSVLMQLPMKEKPFREKIVFLLPFLMSLMYMQTGQGFSDYASMLRLIVMFSAAFLITYRDNNSKQQIDKKR